MICLFLELSLLAGFAEASSRGIRCSLGSATGEVTSGRQPLGLVARMELNMANQHLILEAESSPAELSGEIDFKVLRCVMCTERFRAPEACTLGKKVS